MNYRKLGMTGLTVSEIGFGGWGIGGDVNGSIAYGPTSDRESLRALRRAFELGITFYDTSDFYGFGHSEELIGASFKDVRDRVILATKVGLLNAKGDQDFSPSYIRRALESSLRRLQTDYIDVYQLHSPSIQLLEQNEQARTTLESLCHEGKIRVVGISVRSPDDGLAAIERLGFQCVQVNFNLTDQRAYENGFFKLCEKTQVGVVIRTPLSFGFLTGQYGNVESFAPSDHRNKWSSEQRNLWAEAYQLFRMAVRDYETQTSAQIALRFCLSYPAVSTVIPGMLLGDHVEENVLASDWGSLSDRELSEIREIYRSNRFLARK